jgi:hypothetical protein
VQSTCLAQGIEINIKGKKCTDSFQCFVDKYYLPFAEEAIRHFFALGFVAWRLRKTACGDAVPEVIPLGLFSWRIDSMPSSHALFWDNRRKIEMDSTQQAAQRAFERQKAFFQDAPPKAAQSARADSSSPAYKRQRRAMQRIDKAVQLGRDRDDSDTKMLRYPPPPPPPCFTFHGSD